MSYIVQSIQPIGSKSFNKRLTYDLQVNDVQQMVSIILFNYFCSVLLGNHISKHHVRYKHRQLERKRMLESRVVSSAHRDDLSCMLTFALVRLWLAKCSTTTQCHFTGSSRWRALLHSLAGAEENYSQGTTFTTTTELKSMHNIVDNIGLKRKGII